jgi:hypothetical protein
MPADDANYPAIYDVDVDDIVLFSNATAESLIQLPFITSDMKNNSYC